MYTVSFTTKSNTEITIFFSNNITVSQATDGTALVQDGLHNNGGWALTCTYQEAVERIAKAIV